MRGQPEQAWRDRNAQEVAKAETFIDAFYSFDASVLAALLNHAESSKPDILYYQGWAQGRKLQDHESQTVRAIGE